MGGRIAQVGTHTVSIYTSPGQSHTTWRASIMSLQIRKKIAKEVRETGLAGKVDNISIQRLADYAETEHDGDMQVVVDLLLLCQQGEEWS